MTVEELPRNIGAAAAAGACQISLFNPLDCLRIRWQVSQPAHAASISSFALAIIRDEGWWRGLHRPGLLANVAAVSISQGFRMGLYPFVRDALQPRGAARPELMLLSGVISGSIAYTLAAPLYLVKVRSQADVQLKRPFEWPASVRALWVGSTPLVLRGALLTAGQMAGYDGVKKLSSRHELLADGPVLHVVAATIAGVCAATFSSPADVIQTRMQSHGSRSIWSTATNIHGSSGMIGFFCGWSANVVRLVPTFVVGSTIYEQCRVAVGLGFMK
ncbi:hypothetical protein AB1Y20_005895 [Prymnesium parvum]|uniref:Uncharacterized protein n=1 Tax=Prymnesium parvum TaxID=97485 RepID=A0AB34J491_PRYPA